MAHGEREHLLGEESEESHEKWAARKERVGGVLESRVAHALVLLLTVVDAVFVLIDLAHDALRTQCACDEKGQPHRIEEKPDWLEALGVVSFVITTLFLIEIPLQIFAFGWAWFWSYRNAFFHALDATVIIVTFILELTLRGTASEVASLLIILRLWRLVKLSSGVAVGVSEVETPEPPSSNLAKEHAAMKKLLEEERRRTELLERRVGELEVERRGT